MQATKCLAGIEDLSVYSLSLDLSLDVVPLRYLKLSTAFGYVPSFENAGAGELWYQEQADGGPLSPQDGW